MIDSQFSDLGQSLSSCSSGGSNCRRGMVGAPRLSPKRGRAFSLSSREKGQGVLVFSTLLTGFRAAGLLGVGVFQEPP